MDLSIITVTWNSQDCIRDQIESVKIATGNLEYEQIIIDNNSHDNTVKIIENIKDDIRRSPLEEDRGALSVRHSPLEEDRGALFVRHSPLEKGRGVLSVIPPSNINRSPLEGGRGVLSAGNNKGTYFLYLIKNQINLGFAKANNQGLKIAKGQFILFLNPDMELTDQTKLNEMIDYMKNNPSIGIMSCKLVNKNGKVNKYDGPRRFIRPINILVMFFKLHHFFPQLLNKYYYQDLDFSQEQEVETVRGSFMLIRKEILTKLGRAFDERYFIWLEDVDLCREVKELGYKIIYNSNFSCIDLLGRSFSQEKLIKRQKMFYQSVIKYFKKWKRS